MIDVDEVLGTVAVGAICVALLVGVTWGACAMAATTRTDGNIDFCLIEYEAPLYKVTGHRPWRSDSVVARVATLDEAMAAAQKTACRVGKP